MGRAQQQAAAMAANPTAASRRALNVQLDEIADRLDAHLQRMEADPDINQVRERGGMNLTPFHQARAIRWRGMIHVQYISFQGDSKLSLDEAQTYLAWLDSGHAGQHHQMR